jgi:diguanylate cyclase (GGDEF)-like protein
MTLLAGNQQINAHIHRLLGQRRRFVVCHVDVDDFKPYNDQYGYARGDQFLLHLAQLLKSTICHRADFVGHLGGDDFIVVARSSDWQQRIRSLIGEFAESIPSLYSAEHREAGGIRAVDREGILRTYPLATLSIAALEVSHEQFSDAVQVADALRRVKSRAKARPGTSFVLSVGGTVTDL